MTRPYGEMPEIPDFSWNSPNFTHNFNYQILVILPKQSEIPLFDL